MVLLESKKYEKTKNPWETKKDKVPYSNVLFSILKSIEREVPAPIVEELYNPDSPDKLTPRQVKDLRLKKLDILINEGMDWVPNIAMHFCTKCGVCCLKTQCEAMDIRIEKDGSYTIRCCIYNRDNLDVQEAVMPPIDNYQIETGYKRPEICRTFTPAHEYLAMQVANATEEFIVAGDCYFLIREAMGLKKPNPNMSISK